MRVTSRSLLWMATALCGVTVLAGCSSETKHRWLTVFFTGVDAPQAARAGQPAGPAGTNAAPGAVGLPKPPPVYVHQPYAERNCSACHLTGQAQELRPGGGKVCLQCHDQLIGKAKNVHAPVGDGECLACHAPHQSAERHLLTRKGAKVCLDCHEEADLAKVKAHTARSDYSNCVQCHDPHRSDQAKLLRAAQ